MRDSRLRGNDAQGDLKTNCLIPRSAKGASRRLLSAPTCCRDRNGTTAWDAVGNDIHHRNPVTGQGVARADCAEAAIAIADDLTQAAKHWRFDCAREDADRRRVSPPVPRFEKSQRVALCTRQCAAVSAEQRDAALNWGGRLDEAPPGTGFGLSIVRDIVALYDGDMRLDDSPLGGLKVEIELPGKAG